MIETLGTGAGESESTAPTRQEPASVIDWTAGLKVAAGDAALLTELIALFCADAPRRISTLCHALEAGEIAIIVREAHTLKGAAAHIGARAVYSAAMRLEEAATHQDERAVRTCYDTLAHALDCLQAVLASAPWRSGEASRERA